MIAMRFTCTISDDLFSEIESRYGGPDKTKAAIVAAALDDLLHRFDDLRSSNDDPVMISDHQEMITTLAQVTADRDRLTVEIDHKDQVIRERGDEIGWLRGEVSKLNDKLTPAALPELSGPGRRPWWMFWRRIP